MTLGDDLKALLHDNAPEPPHEISLADVRRRAARRRAKQTAFGLAVFALAAGGVAVGVVATNGNQTSEREQLAVRTPGGIPPAGADAMCEQSLGTKAVGRITTVEELRNFTMGVGRRPVRSAFAGANGADVGAWCWSEVDGSAAPSGHAHEYEVYAVVPDYSPVFLVRLQGPVPADGVPLVR